MKKRSIFRAVIIIVVTAAFISCQGQNMTEAQSEKSNTPISAVASPDSVSDLEEGVQVIFKDSKNHIWFNGAKGVYRYDGKQLLLYTEEDGLCSTGLLGIQEDQAGNLYFDTTDGVCKFDGTQFFSLEIIDNTADTDAWKLEQGDLWFRSGWNHGGPFRYDGEVLHKLKFPKSEMEDEFNATYPNVSFNPYGIYSMYYDSDGNVWFGTSSLGLCRFDGESVQWLYEQHLTETPAGGAFGIRSIIEDDGGDFWICNTQYKYDFAKSQSNQLAYNRKPGIGVPSNSGESEYPYFMSVAKDNNGDLWMATYDNGVWRKTGDELVHYPVSNGDIDVLLFMVYCDNNGTIWLGSHNAGAFRYQEDQFLPFNP